LIRAAASMARRTIDREPSGRRFAQITVGDDDPPGVSTSPIPAPRPEISLRARERRIN
jgi:hypothetical protein